MTSLSSPAIAAPGHRVCAVIVTFNRKALLLRCLAAVLGQATPPDLVLIVDNASTDGTRELLAEQGWLQRPGVELLSLAENTGGAGGFHAGLKHAYGLGHDWMWCMDDDCVPEPDALAQLLAAQVRLGHAGQTELGFLASRVLWSEDGSPCNMNMPVLHPRWTESHGIDPSLSRVISSSFVSILISRQAVRKVGLPIRQFFIWFDDSEFTQRVSAAAPSYLVTSSVAMHCTPSNPAPLDFGAISAKTVWKYEYGIRNETSFVFRRHGVLAVVLFILRVAARMRRARTPISLRLKVLAAHWRGIFFNHARFIEQVE